MSQSPAYLQTKVIEVTTPSENSFIDLSAPAYGLPERIYLYGVSSNTIINDSCTGYQEFYDGSSGTQLLSFDINRQGFPQVAMLQPFSSFMEEESHILISSGLNLYFNEPTGNVLYCSITVFYK